MQSEQERQKMIVKANRMLDQGFCLQAISAEVGVQLGDLMDLCRILGQQRLQQRHEKLVVHQEGDPCQ
jgi:hypothetical protein